MKKLLKLSNIGFYVLMLLTFFVIGLYFAAMIDAGKNQGLAGGAIVLGWGVLFGGIAFIAAFFIAYFLSEKIIVKINWVLLVLFLASLGYKYYEFKQRDKLQEERNAPYKEKSTSPTETSPTAMLSPNEIAEINTLPTSLEEEKSMGMGYFAPNFYENPVLYFYANINVEKSLMDHLPYDSITFKRNKYNQFEIATAPPWLVPHILKLDYDMLYFKIESVTQEFAEVVVNTQNGKTSFASRNSGTIIYWPDFLMSMHSVEFFPGSTEKVSARHFEASGEISIEHEFMRPVKVRGEWMEVLLLNGSFQKVGKGWIQWKRDNKLLVMYNLLS